MTKKIAIPLLLTFIILYSCNQKPTNENINKSKITIKVDDRIELFRVAYNLAIMDSLDNKFQACRNEFYNQHYLPYKEYLNHPFVQKIRNGDFWRGHLPALGLAFDVNLLPKKGLDKALLEKTFGWYGTRLDSVSKLMIDFKKTIDFKNNYNINLKPFRDSLQSNQITKKLDSFFRTKTKEDLIIYFDPLNNILSRALGFLPDKDKKRRFLLANICNPSLDSITNEPLILKWDKMNRSLVIHENTHLYTSQLFDKYYTQEFDKKLQQEKYENINTNIDEIIVRAITAKIIEINYGEKEGEFEISRQSQKSRIVYDFLDQYVANKSMSFEEAYNGIMNKLEKSYK